MCHVLLQTRIYYSSNNTNNPAPTLYYKIIMPHRSIFFKETFLNISRGRITLFLGVAYAEFSTAVTVCIDWIVMFFFCNFAPYNRCVFMP